ncbi:MAG: adenylyltransferase/cytidyltransferase family protein [Blastochloris sp.]|nr:adenylyltransferase/cytidyltransferase family protein [Blastochloris sp.]
MPEFPSTESKHLELAQALTKRERLRAEGKVLVFTNGCFDLLHEGHVRYLEEARAEGDVLWVAINSDASVRRLKGPGRPVRAQARREELLSRLECVDAVLIFEEEHVTPLLLKLSPDLYAKGGDYNLGTIDPGLREALEKSCIQVRFLSQVPGISTTLLLEKLSPEELQRLNHSGAVATCPAAS